MFNKKTYANCINALKLIVLLQITFSIITTILIVILVNNIIISALISIIIYISMLLFYLVMYIRIEEMKMKLDLYNKFIKED